MVETMEGGAIVILVTMLLVDTQVKLAVGGKSQERSGSGERSALLPSGTV